MWSGIVFGQSKPPGNICVARLNFARHEAGQIPLLYDCPNDCTADLVQSSSLGPDADVVFLRFCVVERFDVSACGSR